MKKIRFDVPRIMLDGEAIPPGIENLKLEIPDDTSRIPMPLSEEHSFTVELGEQKARKLREMLHLDKIDWLTHQMNTVWKDNFFGNG